jgi:8-hydroxy-5-deazaflavin:NADPH oxidoreductase
MNAIVPPEELDGLLWSSCNHLPAAILATDPIVEGGASGRLSVERRRGRHRFKLGKLNEGGALVHARGRTWGRLIFQDLFKKEQ